MDSSRWVLDNDEMGEGETDGEERIEKIIGKKKILNFDYRHFFAIFSLIRD